MLRHSWCSWWFRYSATEWLGVILDCNSYNCASDGQKLLLRWKIYRSLCHHFSKKQKNKKNEKKTIPSRRSNIIHYSLPSECSFSVLCVCLCLCMYSCKILAALEKYSSFTVQTLVIFFSHSKALKNFKQSYKWKEKKLWKWYACCKQFSFFVAYRLWSSIWKKKKKKRRYVLHFQLTEFCEWKTFMCWSKFLWLRDDSLFFFFFSMTMNIYWMHCKDSGRNQNSEWGIDLCTKQKRRQKRFEAKLSAKCKNVECRTYSCVQIPT